MIVGLSGFARAGKDSTADVLVNDFGFTRVAFADKLRDMLYALNPLVAPTPEGYFVNSKNPTRLQEVIDDYGWNDYKETQYGPEIRRLMQRMGTEAGRQTLWDTIWIDAALVGLDEKDVVITDARFLNEFDAISSRGGEIWRIDRPGVGPSSQHPSEVEALKYNNFMYHIQNAGTLEDLQYRVHEIMAYHWD